MPLLWLCGPSGVGKSTLGPRIQRALARDGYAVGFVDADQLGLCYPAADDDPENYRVKARNLAATLPGYRAAGVRCLVFSGGVHTLATVRTYTDLLPDDVSVTVCRLRADPGELRERFVRRGWYTDLADLIVREAEALDRSGFADVCVDTSGLSVPETVRKVLERTGGRLGRAGIPAPADPATAAPGTAAPGTGLPGTGLPADAIPDVPVDPVDPVDRVDPADGPAGGPAEGSVAEGSVADDTAADGTVTDDPPPVPLLWLCGPTAVGKSSIGWEVFVQTWREDGIKAAYVDLRQIGFRLPAAADDPGDHRLAARNLAAMWPVFRAAGARCLIVSGAAAEWSVVRAYADALPGAALTVCRLRATPGTLAERVLLRGRGEGPNIPGDTLKGRPAEELRRAAREAVREAEELERAGLGDLCVDTDRLSAADVARLVRTRAASAGSAGGHRSPDGHSTEPGDDAGGGEAAGDGNGGRPGGSRPAVWPARVSRAARPGTRSASG